MANRLNDLVEAYARRIYPAVDAHLEPDSKSSVCSPLGIWLLLAAVGPADPVDGLAEILGCPIGDAAELLTEFVGAAPPALAAAVAVWVAAEARTERLARWEATLPAGIEHGPIPSPAEADAWAERHTLGLIKRFPLTIDALTKLVLSSALATRVSWVEPFTPVSSDRFGPASAWRNAATHVLADRRHGAMAIIDTEAAGRVAVHGARAREGLSVVSVIAAPGVGRDRVWAASHDAAAVLAGRPSNATRVGLVDLPLGGGHAWTHTETTVRADEPGGPLERYEAVLPQWRADSEMDLMADPAFGIGAAGAALIRLLPPADLRIDGRQVATATYSRYGFEAAAVTSVALRASAVYRAHERQQRLLEIRFDRPFAVLALASPPAPDDSAVPAPGAAGPDYTGLPVFTAWVADITEVTDLS